MICRNPAPARAIMRARARREGPPILWWNVQKRDCEGAGAARCVTDRKPSLGWDWNVGAGGARTAARCISPPTEGRCGDTEHTRPFSERDRERARHNGEAITLCTQARMGPRNNGRGRRYSAAVPCGMPQLHVLKVAACLLKVILLSCTTVWPVQCQTSNTVVDAPVITSLVADDPDNLDGVYANLDTITIAFDKATDRAGLAQGVVQTRGTVDSLFSFDQALGASYRGVWKTSSVFEITILDWPGSAPPRVGPEGLIVTPLTSAGRAIRADPFTVGLSTQASEPSPRMEGDFGKELIRITAITAANPSGEGDAYSVGDTITIDFNIPTNEGFTTLGGSYSLSKAQLDNLFTFSHDLGASYSGVWVTPKQIVITVLDVTGAGPPPILEFRIQVKASGDLRNDPPACAPSTSLSPYLQGEWGACMVEILQIMAVDPTLPPNINRDFSVNDTITITFNKDTNQADLPPNTWLSKQQVDSVFWFSQSLGADYVGNWLTRRSFQIRSVEPAGATPQIGFFTLEVKESAGLRNFPPQSTICVLSSDYLLGNWGTIIPKIIDFYSNGDGGTDGDLDRGDTLTIDFYPPTNRFRMTGSTASRAQIDEVLNFSLAIGADYTGLWLTDRLFEITIQDADGSDVYQRGRLFVNCIESAIAPIRNADGISGGCFSRSPSPVRGDFGESAMTLSLQAMGDDSSAVTAGDQVLMTFSEATDQAINGVFANGAYGNITKVDKLFSFSQTLGLNYEGSWQSSSEFLITILETHPSEYPTIGSLTATILFDANLRNFPPNSAPLTATSSAVTGDFGPNEVFISELVASDPTQSSATYAPGDTIGIYFSHDTNRAELGDGILSKSTLDRILTFSTNIGASYEGRWVTRKLLQIAITDVSGAGPPLPEIFTLEFLASAGLRNFPVTSASAGISSPALSGDFGPSPIRVLSMVASDSLDLDNVYGVGDTLTITFNQDTNKAQLSDNLDKSQIDFLFDFTESLGADYTGEWLSSRVLVITARDVTGAGPPAIGGTRATVRAEAKLRNVPPVCAPSTTTTPRISGDWGILYPRVTSIVADDPTDKNSVYSFLDTITITFSIPTNRNGMNNGDRLSRTQLLSMFLFSESMGNSFSGEWVSAQVLMLTVEGTSGAAPPTIGGFYVTCRTDGGSLLKNEVGTSRPCSEQSPRMRGDFGPSPIFISVLLASDPTGLGSRYRAGNAITVFFSEDTNRGGYQQGQVMSKSGLNNMFDFSASLGYDYRGEWVTRKELVITIINEYGADPPPIPGIFTVSVVMSPALIGAFGPSTIEISSWVAGPPVGFDVCQGFSVGVTMTVTFSEVTNRAGFDGLLTRTDVDSLFSFGIFSLGQGYVGEWTDDQTIVITITDPLGATPVEIGFAVAKVRATANLRPIPPVTEPAEPVAPPMIGEFGPPNVEIVSFFASDPDSGDAVFSTGDEIGIDFNIPTNQADLPDNAVTRAQLDSVFQFSMSIGQDYVGRWNTPASLRITILNATEDPSNQLFHPPYVGFSGLKVSVKKSGPSDLQIISLKASSLGADSIYGLADQMTITFSEATNMGGSYQGQVLSPTEVRQMFNFSQALGSAYSGAWTSPSTFQISIEDNLGALPPEIGHLVVIVLAAANIRNNPPQSSVTVGITSPVLDGNFGPSTMEIVAFTAHDPENSANVYHAGVNIAVIISERPSWKKMPVYDGMPISKLDLVEMLSFSVSLGQDYTGQWLVKDRCPWRIYSDFQFIDGPPCFGVLIEVLDITGHEGPEIGELTVTFLASGDVRNMPVQSAPTVARSLPITGDWGITIPYVKTFFAQDGADDEGYTENDRIFMQFSEITDRASMAAAQMDKETLDKLFYFDQSLGADYEGRWLAPDLIRVTVLDAAGAGPPEIGTLTVTIRNDGGYELRNEDSTSFASDKVYTFDEDGLEYGLTGSFGRVSINLIEIEAFSAEPPPDDRWGIGDVVTITFSRVVNKGCYQGCPDVGVTNARILTMLSFSDALWDPDAPVMGAMTGRWLSDGAQKCSSCLQHTSGVCKQDAVLDADSGLYLNVTNRPCVGLQGDACPSGYSLCNSRILQIIGDQLAASEKPPTINGLQIALKRTGKLRNYPASIEPVAGDDTKSPLLRGNFGPPCVRIKGLAANDPIGYNGDFTNGDTITIDFNQPTNLAGGGENLDKNGLLNIIDFYCNDGQFCPDFASDYQGTWTSRQQLQITVLDVSNTYAYDSNANPMETPLPGDFYLKFREGVYLVNYPPACLPYAPLSNNLTGTFGPSNIAITMLEADDPFNIASVWDPGDTLRIRLSRSTDYAGKGPGTVQRPWRKEEIDQVFQPSCPAFDPNCVPVPFGLDYTGRWWDRSTFQLTLLKAHPNHTALDGEKCCERNFEVKILRTANLRHFPPTSDPADTCGGPNACPEVGFPTSQFWGGTPEGPGCTEPGRDLSLFCEKLIGDYGTPFPNVESFVGSPPTAAISEYGVGARMTITFSEYSNMGACRDSDQAELVLPYPPCYGSFGTCSLVLPIVPADDSDVLETICGQEGGTFVPKDHDESFDNCQLPERTTEDVCSGYITPSGAGFGVWTAGLAPHQSCSEAVITLFEDCEAAGGAWRIHTTIIPQSNILKAMDFSHSMGTVVTGSWMNYGPIQAGVCTVPCAKTFQITVRDDTAASPPEIDLFFARMNPNRGIAIRRSFEFSPGSDSISKGMSGNFGPPTVIMNSLTAGANPTPSGQNSRGPLTGLYEEGCTITVGFDRFTNRGNFSQKDLPKSTIDKIFTFSKSLGSDYTGEWTNCTLYPGKTLSGCQSLVITVKNASGASPPTVLGLQATLLETGNIRNYPSAAAPASGLGPLIAGNFGPSSVYIERLVADDPGGLHTRFDVGDVIYLIFNMPTNRADMELNRDYDKAAVDSVMKFSAQLARDYTGVWTDNAVFEIRIKELDPDGPLPYIGSFKVELQKSGNVRNFPVTSDQTASVSAPLSGGFGLSTLFILSSVASDPEPIDTTYSDGDRITIKFSQSTNKAGLPDANITKEQLNNLLHFSMPLGDSYQGSWLSDSVLEIVITNSTKPATTFWCEPKQDCDHVKCAFCATHMDWHTCVRQLSDSSLPDYITNQGTADCPSCDDPLIVKSRLTNNGTSDCRFCPKPLFQWMKTGICQYVSDGGYAPPLLDLTIITVKQAAELREVPPILKPSTGIDETGVYPPAYLSGGFAYSTVELKSLVARDPDKADSTYSVDDLIAVTFNQPTNKGNLPDAGVNKAQIDTLFSFSHALGKAYSGHWPNSSTFIITLLDITGNEQPIIDEFYVTTREEGKLRDVYGVSDAVVVSGNRNATIVTLKGEFGPSTIFIRSFRASSPESRSDVYNVGAAFTISFSEDTNRGGLPVSGWTKAQIDNAFDFYSDLYDPHPLGVDYSGSWPDNQTFIISILAVDRDEPKGPPPLTGGNFRVSVKFSGNIRNDPPQCAATVINKFEAAQKGLGGEENPGINCDCCNPCGDCDVCDAYSCMSVLDEFDVMTSVCSGCCGGREGNHCCRILSGNYGKLVSIYSIEPAKVAVTGQMITIIGHGFDGRSVYNKASVGGRDCPVLRSVMDEKTKDGYMICKAPDGIGSDIKAVEVEVFDFFTSPPTSVKGFCCKLLDEDGFVILPRDMIGVGGVMYLPPFVTAVRPRVVPYQKGMIVTVFGGNFGTKRIFDSSMRYIGALGSDPVEKYKPPTVFVVMEGGAYVQCVRTAHVSNNELVCETPEMTSLNVSIVPLVVDQRSRAWEPGSLVAVETLPRYKYDCPMEQSGRCFDCCEAECQFQFESGQGNDDLTLAIEGFQRFCKIECYKFCGFQPDD